MPEAVRALGAAALCICAALVLSACPPVEPPRPPVPPVDPCATFRCDTAGRTRCVVEGGLPRCACDEGLEDRAGLCLPPAPPDPCDPNPCNEPNRGVCRGVNGVALCGCDEGFELEGGLCQPFMPITCDDAHEEGDPFEPDECPDLARDIGASGEQREPHTFFPAADNDWYRVEARAEEIFFIRLAGTGGDELGFRAEVFLAASGGTGELVQLGTQHTGTGELDFAVKAPQAGTLFFRTRAGTFTQTGEYEVSIGSLGLDDYADGPQAAVPHGIEDPHEGVLQFEGDADALRFDLGPQRSYRVQATLVDGEDSEGPPLTARVEVHALMDDGITWGLQRPIEQEGLDVVLHAAQAGPRVLRVSTTGADAMRRGLRWTLRLTDLGADDHPDGPGPGEASDILFGISATGMLEREGDVDAFRFDAQGSYVYRFRCVPPQGLDCHVRLLGPNGAQVAADTDGGEGVIFRKLLTPGPHVALVSGPGTFAYSYTLEDFGPDDHGDDFTRATSLGMPVVTASGTANIQFPGDRDMLHVDWDPGHIYRITCTRVTLGDCRVRVFDAMGLPLAQDVDGGDALFYFDHTVGGDSYIEIQGGPGQLGTVTWRIDDLEHDDHGNTLASGTLLFPNNAWVTGEVQYPADRDWFRFTPTAGRSYRVTCLALPPQTLGQCELQLYDLSETMLAQAPAAGEATLQRTASSAAPLAFRVTGTTGAMGTYLVKVEELP